MYNTCTFGLFINEHDKERHIEKLDDILDITNEENHPFQKHHTRE